MSEITYKYLSWEDVEQDCLSIYANMRKDNYKPEVILGLLRGGVVPARIFMDFYDVSLDFCTLDVKMYDGIAIRRNSPVIKDFLGDKINGKRVLIADDIWDSGKTMNAVLEYLKPKNVSVTTATLYWKATAKDKPNYYAQIVGENEWVIFPFEKYEFWRLINN